MLTLTTACDSSTRSLATARELLAPPTRSDAALPVLGAAALCAACALALAGSVVLGPPGAARAAAVAVMPSGG